ncbi:MAG: 16S rRNA (uracil(1498)-N(3))-methyltransferase [Gammaproteobacteria bacterium]|nr:16S rRNA (uracil(1498)-N(3))-methyltransferase [Gammaproteobacteria bacterium]
MRNTRVYLPTPLHAGETVNLDERARHHLVTVLRFESGMSCNIFDGQGNEYSATLEVKGKHAHALLQSKIISPRESPLALHLGQGICRNDRMDWVTQKAVELGVQRITPIITERTQTRMDVKRETKRMEHWQAIIIAACEQSGRCYLPTLHAPLNVPEWLDACTNLDACLLLDPQGAQTVQSLPTNITSAALFIGPEGGLSDKEREAAYQQNWQGLRLGPRILRTETAALTGISILQARWGDFI